MRDRNNRGRGGNDRRGGYRNNRGGNRRYGSNNRNWKNKGRQPAHKSGNLRERIAVESGSLVIIDQFMLANPQFHAELIKLIDQDPEAKNDLIMKYGGAVIQLNPGNYRILRNPYTSRIIIHSSDHDDIDFEEVIANADGASGQVVIDTRCLAMIDRELLDDTDLLEKYQQLWFSDQSKACRDLLRDNGGAVRYGFERFGDELDVYCWASENTVCLSAAKAKETGITEPAEQLAEAVA